MLEAIQARVLATRPATVVLVEGLSDCFAVEAVAARLGRALDAEGVGVLPMGGVTNAGRFLAALSSDVRLVGLCDVGEEAWFRTRLAGAGARGSDLFTCDRDLEDELIRSLGADAVVAVIDRQGELDSLRALQQMPFHRGRPLDQQLHRFLGVRSGRKYRYARLLAEELDANRVPAPLRDLLACV